MTLPTWMWGDPADVAERVETGERNAHLRAHRISLGEARIEKPSPNYGLVGADTLRLIKRARIRELVRIARSRP